ncbi:peptide ABC transporter substrate-binding protein [Secundilactobacillus malefermentans]|uniref:peptide ABC transporter substrate-binding protein n=2 Tax=Secundilactobacillus malefermentans TaxID=176292 RepID=UPI0011C8B9C3|nr:peptide ABC transporter substrate-binding protein [Secundilactobacillus malefermentans]QEA30769.1 peptide ABC transporter substrate-binding protein [Secundilactobacillus malefermentans]
MKKQRVGLVLGVLVMTAITLVGCGKQTSSSGPSTQDLAKKQEVTILSNKEITSIDPSNVIDATTSTMIQNVYEGLYRLNKNNNPQPTGATELPKITNGGKTYTIKLRQSAKWSNGDPVTAQDYVYGLRRGVSSKNAASNLAQYQSVKNAAKIINGKAKASTLGVKALGKYELQITLARPTDYFTKQLTTICYKPLDQKYVESQGKKFGTKSSNTIYNGPFKLTKFTGVGDNWTLVKNDQYWNSKKVKLDTLKFKLVKATATGADLYQAGKADYAPIDGQFVKNMKNDKGFNTKSSSTSNYIGFNFNQTLFKNANTRKALSLVLDRKSLTKNILQDGSNAATGLINKDVFTNTKTNKDFGTQAGTLTSTNVKDAQAAWKQARKELNLKGTTKIKLLTFDSGTQRTTAQYIQGQVHKYLPKLKIELTILPVSNFIKDATAGKFGIYLVSWGADYPDPSSLLSLFASDSGNNWGSYKSKQYDALLDKANGADATKTTARWNDLEDAQKILLKDNGISPLFASKLTYLKNPKLKGMVTNTLEGGFYYANAYLEK